MNRETGNRNGMTFNTVCGVYMNQLEAENHLLDLAWKTANESVKSAEKQLDAVRPYLQHTKDCHEYGVPATEKTIGCTCGLQEALEKE